MNTLLAVIWPMVVGAILLTLWRRQRTQRVIAVVGAAIHLGITIGLVKRVAEQGIQVTVIGDWQPPFGIVFVADRLGAAMVCISAIIGLVISIYSLSGIDARREAFGFHPLVQLLLAGVCGAFLTGDFFNLYVWFEVMLMASFVLMALGGEKKQMMGALQYVALNLLASTTFLIALGLLYGLVGTLNMADVAERLPSSTDPGLTGAVCALLALAFAIKAGVFPVFVWLPSSYHTPPTVVTALFAGLLTKVGVYTLLRGQTLIFHEHAPFIGPFFVGIGVLTMIFGVMGAIAQKTFRRVLTFHIISQIGYIILGIGWMTPLAISATVFYTLHHILVKTNLFLIAGIARRMNRTETLTSMGGLYRAYPWLAFFFLIPALSLAGIPPLSGFWAKLFVLQSGLEVRDYGSVGAAVIVSVFTLFSMLKLWNEAFWKVDPEPEGEELEPMSGRQIWRYLPVGALCLCTVAFGLLAGPILTYCQESAAELLQPELYIRSVLGVPR